MSISLREDVTYILLEKLSCPGKDESRQVGPEDMGDRPTNRTEILLHLKYLNLWGYVRGETEGSHTRLEQTALSEPISLNQVKLTQQGHQFFKRLQANSPHLL